MSKLSTEEIKKIQRTIETYKYRNNRQATEQLVELFERIIKIPLQTWRDYANLYNNECFCTYCTWEALVESERILYDGLTQKECEEQLGKTIFTLPCGWCIQYAGNDAEKLLNPISHDEMIKNIMKKPIEGKIRNTRIKDTISQEIDERER